jgi:signal transduction histidine kinase
MNFAAVFLVEISRSFLINFADFMVDQISKLVWTLQMKETYNASMIHELRNPLNAVIGSLGLLSYSTNLNQEDIQTLNIASMSGEILMTLINNSLDGAKIEANKLELDFHKVSIEDVLKKSANLFGWKSKEKSLQLTLALHKGLPREVEIDDARLIQGLVNLIGNAVKFTVKGSVKIRASFIDPNEQ